VKFPWHQPAGAASAEVVGGHAARSSSRGARGGGPPGSAPPPAVRKKVLVPQATRDQGYGRIGRPVELLCNHFAVKLTNMTDIYHYNVTYLSRALFVSELIRNPQLMIAI